MNTFAQFLAASPFVDTIGLVLLHFLWQGTVVAVVAAIALRALSGRRAEARYAVACGALATMLLLPVVTFAFIHEQQPAGTPANAGAPVTVAGDEQSSLETASILTGDSQFAARAMPVIVSLWLAGVLFFSLRLVSGLVAIEKLARRTSDLPAELLATAERLAERLAVPVAVRFAQSTSVDVPTVIGWLRPVVLVPASALTGLTHQQLETLLVHELAHIRRYDYLVNLMQSAVETTLFYHPAVWWISNTIRTERELCCDDVVVDLCDDPLVYARALTELESLRLTPAFTLGANGGSLRDRVVRLLNPSSRACSQRGRASTALVVIAAAALLFPTTLAARALASQVGSISNLTITPAKAAGLLLDVVGVDTSEPLAKPQPPAKLASLTAGTPATSVIDVEAAPEPEPAPLPEPAPDPEPAPEIDESPRSARDEEIDRAIKRKMFGVTEEYREQVKRAGYDLDDDKLIQFRIHGITAEYITEMNAAGFGRLEPKQLVNFRIHGINAAYVTSMRNSGLGKLSAEELVQVKIHGITPAFRQEMESIAGRPLPLRELLPLRIHGVDSERVRAARRMFPEASLSEVVSMHIHGVTPAYLAAMRERGYAVEDVEEATKLRIHGVTPEWIDSIRAAGYARLDLEDLLKMKIFGLDATYLRRVREAGLTDLTIDQLVRLRAAGIDPTELKSRD